MDTAEMRLLTVPQFARRVDRSVDEVLALIQNRDVKALRPDLEGGYRVLETEVDRLLQEKTRIKRPAPKAAPVGDQAEASAVSLLEVTPSRTVPMETHLATVTTLESLKSDNARLERLNSSLQAELFQYRRLFEESKDQLIENRSRLEASQQQLFTTRLEKIELERQRVEEQQAATKKLALELAEAKRLEAEQSAIVEKKSFWQRLFG